MSVRHDWYQTDAKVVITVLLKNAVEKNYAVDIEPQRVRMIADGDYALELQLFRAVNVERSSHKAFATKVEITLGKETAERWEDLELKVAAAAAAPPQIKKRNWDSLVKEAEKTEEEEAKHEQAMQRLFKQIYSTSSPEVRKAMNKSYLESGGTVLSTNWSEVSKDKVEVKAPDGMEFRKWDQ